MIDIPNTSYSYEESRGTYFRQLSDRVSDMRKVGSLSPDVLHRIRRLFRIKNIYHSNAIEGNILEMGETRQVVELGLTITGKPLKDQAEARNLSEALDFLEEIAGNADKPIIEIDIRQLHALVLKGIDDGAGTYRTVPVRISGSEFPPPGPEAIAGEMQDFASWLSDVSVPDGEAFASVDGLIVAAVAHAWFVMIHPFIDGNGRVARLLMNLLLMRYGFPIAIITKEDRLRYYDALEASQISDLTPFAVLLAECIEESLEEYERAAKEQEQRDEWVQTLAQRFTQPEETRARNQYEVWRNAMELLKSYFRRIVDTLNESARSGNIYFKDFGNLEFEKYWSLSLGESAKRTWFFRVDFRRGDRSARYLFFFGYGTSVLRQQGCNVTLHAAREEPENSYNYERLDNISAPNIPNLVEIGYKDPAEQFVSRGRFGHSSSGRIERFANQFFEDIVDKHFGE